MKRDIAIIGISCRFPDASTLEGLYDNMRMGRDSLKEISLSRLKGTTLPESGSYRVCGYLEDIDKFDYSFFNISPGEAQTMDPHQRLLLEVVYETFENAGYNIGEFSGSNTSVYVSDSNLEYYHHADDFVPTLKTGNVKAFLGSRISRQFNFTGNVSMIDTSCSSSLVAVHLACNELILGDSDYGLVCGVNLDLFPYKESEGSLDLDSPDGKSRPFTTEANGMSFGEAVISILLKPLEKAQRSGDHIHGVIKGSAINNNGDRSASLTAPDSVTQAEVIKRAWIKAGVIPEDIGYIEAHGSGTQLGDSIEVGGLDSAISSFTSKKNLCPISTIKSNLGHCRGAAGLAGMVRAILSIQHKELFPTVHFSQGSSLIDFDNSSVYVTETLKPWEVETGKRRYAGVSSIGLSGVNCHLVLAEPPEMPETEEVSRKELVTISSKTPSGLRRNKEELGEYLKRHVNSLQDISYTLGVGRQHHKHRYSFICKDVSDLLEDIISGDEQTDPVSVSGRGMDRLIMVFMDRVDVTLQDIGQYVVFYEAFNSAYCNCERNYKGDTGSAIFTGFAFQYSLYKLLEVSGIMIKDVLGLGIGRLLAGVISGEYSLSEGLERLLSYEEEPLEDLGLRIGSMIGRETSKDQVGFVLAGADPIVLSMFEAHDHGRNYYTYRLGSGFTDDMLLRFMQWCYDRGYHLDWDLFYKDRGGRRVALPVYQFEKTRCWIRESPKVNLSINGSDSSSVRGVLLRGGGNEILHRIAEIWSEVLEIKEFSLGDDFFELGGNSLKATTVIHQLNSDFGILLDFEDIFEYPTLQGLGDYISCQYSTTDRVKSYWQDVLKLSDIGIDDNFFELGGHSLIANQIINRLIGEYNIVLSFEDFFRYPTVRSLSAYVESLQLAEDGGVEAIPVIESQDYYELSVFQKRLWLLSQFREASVAYNQAEVFEISGFLDRAAFESSFRDLVSRHDSLRTIFTVLSGVPKQRVQPVDSLGFTILYIDLRGVSSQEEKVAGMISEESHTPFDLAGGPLVRCKLLQTGEKSYIFLFTTHHIISDGWSMGVMVREISSLYTSYKEGSEGSLPLLRTQYKDYTGWLNKRFAGDTLSSLRAYWLTVFSGPLPLLSLPLDYKRPLVKTYEGRRVSFELDRNTARMLNKKSQAQGVSLFMILLGTIKVLLYRYTGQEDIILGVPVAGRGHKDLEDQIGFYVNTLAIRTRFSGEDSFTALLEKVKEATLGAYRHQIYPFDWLIQDLNLDRDLSRSPLFDVAVTFNNTEINNIGHVTMPGLTVKEYDTEVSNSKFDLSINIKEFNDKLFFDLDYNTDLFKRERIERFIDHYKGIVRAVLKDLDQPVCGIDYLGDTELEDLTVNFNNTRVSFPADKSIQELFESQVFRTPDAIAVCYGEQYLSYGELNERSNQLGAHLRESCGVGCEDLIGIMLDKSEKLMVGILGILKSGGAYLPIDPGYPKDRKAYMISDSNLKVLLTEGRYSKDLDFRLMVDIDSEEIYANEAEDLVINNYSSIHNYSSDLIYVIYTSGTTGHPKGVQVEHRSVVNLSTWLSELIYKKHDGPFTALLTASVSFDASVQQLFPPLLNGGKLVVLPEEKKKDPDIYISELVKHQVEVIDITPSYLSVVLLAMKGRNEKLNIKYTLVGGEVLGEKLFKDYVACLPNSELINVYGITEATVNSTFELVQGERASKWGIGKPLGNTRLYILDDYGQIVPIGVIGELYIGGAGVGRGYLNRVGLTYEKFKPNKYSEGELLYRTGDLCCWLSDGNIEFVGRKDTQVKIRGYRIELGEIENSLLKYSGIEEALVVVQEGSNDEEYLVGYYVSISELKVSEIRTYLSEQLPDYMIPVRFMEIDDIPLTVNGKVDYGALPDPTKKTADINEYVGARNDIEERLVNIWQKILPGNRIGVLDNFFDLGGHSISALRMVVQVLKDLGVEINIRDVFSVPTIEGLSTLISNLKPSEYVSIGIMEDQEYYGMSHGQRRLWVIEQFGEDHIAYNMPAVYQMEGYLDEASLTKSFASLIERHEILRTSFITVDGVPRQKVNSYEESGFAIERIDIQDFEDKLERLDSIINAEISSPFDLGAGSMLRVKLIKIERSSYILVSHMHHIVSDAWSVDVLINDIVSYYNGYLFDKSYSLPSLEIQYKDYSRWQSKQLFGAGLNSDKTYWLDQLSGLLPVLSLSTDYVRPQVKTFKGAAVPFRLSKALVSGLEGLGQVHGSSLFMVLMASLKALLYRYTGQGDIIIGTPVAGRDHLDLEGQIGFYINTLALRTGFSGSDTFEDLLQKVKEVTLDGYEHQGYPFDQLVEELDLERDSSHSAVFDIMLVFQNADIGERGLESMDGLQVRSYPIKTQVSKFDITLNLWESEDGGLSGSVQYNTDLYKSGTIERFIGHYNNLLSSVLLDSRVVIGKINYIGEAERDSLLYGFNTTRCLYPMEKTLPCLFEAQVITHPDALAVVYEGISLTYKELNARSNQLASYLRTSLKLGKGDYVGVMLDRSEWMVISILGILKAGASYVPIDMAYPWSRVFYLLEETEVKVLLTDQEARDEETTRGIIRISPFRSWAEIGTYPSSDLQLGVDSGSVAYIMYTSGTTGRPKGVMVSHKNILRLVKSPNYVSLKAGTRLLQTGALSFDATTFEIWGILLNGGELHLLPHAKLMDVPSLKKKISETGIDIMWITSSWFNQLVDSDVSLFSDLGQIIVGGDKLSVSHIKKLRSSEKSLGIINAYGPTENTTFSTYYPIGMVEADDSIPIGKPISNSTVYILDSDRQLVPIGVDGEIYVGGDGVALGYWKRDELTADCFIKSPYAEGGLLYRTGDLGCWLPDGNVAFKGRIDNQVKVRGYRVEPTEVAQILKEHSHVSDSMVIAHKDPSGDTQLLAYIVSDGTLDSAHMNSYLMDHLPSYMLPSFYIFLTEFPLTVNGKVDRSSLPVPGSYSLTEGTTYVAPVTVLDQKLCSLWEEVLQRSPIGIRDSFFDHGGHSLKALQIISRINKAFGSALSIKDIFMHPSVEGLSTQLKAVGGEASYEAIAGIEEQFYYDVSSSQRRLWILSLFTGNETAYNITDSYVFEGILDPEALASSFESLLARHEILRTTFIDVGGDPKQRVHAIGKRCLDYDYIDMKGSGSDAVRLKIESLSGMGFDLQEGPLLRLRLLQLEECKHIFVLSMHHIISDAWSMGVLVREVITLYNAYKQGDCNPLSALRLQYKDYSVWENTRLRSGGLAAQKQYWLSELSGSLPVLEIPGENVRPSVKTYKGNTLGFVLDPHVTAAIINLSQIEQTSIFIILLTTVKMLLHRYSQQDDIIVGTTVAGRDHIALEDQIGFYVNTLALRTRYSEGESFISLLGKVKATMLEVYSHQQYPFDRLVEDLQLSRDMSRSALFDVLVEMLNTESGVASGEQLEGLEVRRYDIDQTISKYDISFRFSESTEGIHVSIEYNSDLYTEERIGYMAEHYRLLVSGVLEDVGVRIKSFPLLSLGELQMLTGYNDSYIGYDTDETLLELFKRQVLRNPSGIALSYKDRMLSYEQLDDQSGQLSAYLISQYDIGREDIVGIMLSKSEQMVVSLLGVMKCGGSFLAIDSSYPSGRISYMLSDSSVKLLITESDYLYSVGSYYQGSLLSLDIELPLILEEEQSGEVDQPWDSLAYVMYTSGSTGDPKGVGIEVGNLTNYIRWANGYYFGDEGGYPFALFTSLSFDLTLTSLFSTLLRGDIVHIYEDSVSTGDVLRDIFSNPGLIRAVKLTPSHIKVLDRLGLSQTHISEVIVGGEELTVDQVRVLRELNPEVNIYNEYGPTETTIGCTVKKIDAEDALISIGSPIGNTQIYILSDEKALQPLGVSGEIYVGGSGVGRGYLNRVGLTNLCFIEDKINGSGRLYKTGDIGRWQLNGEIVYMGRKDEQVKIHGYRIETGEVESVLLQHPLVSSAIVVSKELQGEKTLVAYIVSAEELSGQQMKTWLGSYLPAYMLPAYYVQIAAVPLTGSGKTAKGLLPDPLVGVQGSGVAYLGARTRLESRLVEIWKGVLGLERVGIRDNFFDLGGDSLKLVSLNQQICEQFQSNITITDLFKYTTVEMIGSYLEGEKRTTFEQGIEV